jgi:chromosome segregation ATPase
MFSSLRRRLDNAVRRRVDEHIVAYETEAQRVRDDYEARLGGLQADYDFLRSEFDRLAPQLASLEYRIERLSSGAEAPGDEQASAAAEHERARLRMEIVSHYEERLRRLEEARP